MAASALSVRSTYLQLARGFDAYAQPSPIVCVAVHLRHEAAYKLTGNAEAVAKFACRGAGRGSGWNLLPGRAPLSDPNATPNLEFLPDVDYCLRRVRGYDFVALRMQGALSRPRAPVCLLVV